MSDQSDQTTRTLDDVSTDATDWFGLMRKGAFAAAWRLSDAGVATIASQEWRRPRHEQRIWRGDPIDDRDVLVRCYHGLGDTIQFVRYLPMVRQRARTVTLWVQPELIPLLAWTPTLGRLSPLHDGTPDIPFDVDVEIMELAHVFRTTVDTVPNDVPYLRVPPGRALPALSHDDGRLTVGLAWRAGTWDPRRSIALAEWAPLLESPVLRVIPLHDRRPSEDAAFAHHPPPLSLDRFAALLTQCDVIVSVDTMAAHLAGALGLPTCLMLHADADWRWMSGRADSPWYPTMRLYRQQRPGEWGEVLAAVSEHVHHEATRRMRQRTAGSPRPRGAARQA